jgi:HD-GYP domain-containing protein (c-di-GMP phosphodiesterase class II)
MNSARAILGLRIGSWAAAVVLLLAGAMLNSAGRDEAALPLAGVAGLLAVAAGAAFRWWRLALPALVAAVILTLFVAQFNPQQGDLALQFAGLVLLAGGGAVGILAYRHLRGQLRRQAEEVARLTANLGLKHHAFMAATADADGSAPGDPAAITAGIAANVGADFACCYLTSGDGRRFVPQPPGLGVERLRPQAINRPHGNAGPLLAAIEARSTFSAPDENGLVELIPYVPDDFHLGSLLAVPMPMDDHIGGFVVLGRTGGAFTDDDRRLATTLATRAGAYVASAQLVAQTRHESARYSLMNELVKEASGMGMNEVLDLVLGRGSEVIRYDTGRALLFQADNTYLALDGTGASPEPIDGPLGRVHEGETMLRNLVTEDEGIYSGLHPERLGGTVNEALTPIRGKAGVIGVLCLGRKGPSGFSQHDLSALDDLGSMAGVAVENSRILQVVTGQASRLDTALDALGEVSAALTTVTQGSRVLEQKTLEAAIRVVDGCAGLLTRSTEDGCQATIMAVGLDDLEGTQFQNGQGIVGATMLSTRTTAVQDLAAQPELASPPDLAGSGIKAAICTPMLEDGRLWGTLSVFDDKKREWTADDQRVLATIGNQGVVAVRNAELYEKNERSIWELSNLQEALQAATSTLDLNQVLQQVLAGAARASSAQIGCLALDDSGRLVLKGGFGTDHSTAEKLALDIGGDICQRVLESGAPVMEARVQESKAESPLNPRAVLCVPITLRGKPLGVLFLANYKLGHVFTSDHRNLVMELATQAAVAIDNARLFKDREEVIFQSLVALANTSDARDRYTAGHSQRVTQYALMIARQMQYSPTDQSAWVRLERGARLHDIGKIGVPDEILRKAGKLTDQEFEKMKSHTTVGFNILGALKMLTDELVIVRSHHERYDGNGYPDHKKGEELPIFAWIVSAADAIDAMTSDRPYRKGMSLEVALEEVRQGAGTHFHPDVAEAVLDAAAGGTLKVIPQQSLNPDAPTIGAFENPTN